VYTISYSNAVVIAHKVLAIRRFCSPNKQTVGLQGCKTVAE